MAKYRFVIDPDGTMRVEQFTDPEDEKRERERMEQMKEEAARMHRNWQWEQERVRRAQEEFQERLRNAFGNRGAFGGGYAHDGPRGGFNAKGGASSSSASVSLERISGIFRTLAKKWHPDKGGTTQAMQALNDAHAEIKKLFGVK